jgi:hypothetical protein
LKLANADLDVVIESRQCLYENVNTFVGELVSTRREKIQRFVQIKIQLSGILHKMTQQLQDEAITE